MHQKYFGPDVTGANDDIQKYVDAPRDTMENQDTSTEKATQQAEKVRERTTFTQQEALADKYAPAQKQAALDKAMQNTQDLLKDFPVA